MKITSVDGTIKFDSRIEDLPAGSEVTDYHGWLKQLREMKSLTVKARKLLDKVTEEAALRTREDQWQEEMERRGWVEPRGE